MSRRADYRARLEAGESAEAIAATDSGLPGPRGNLELIAAIADVADADQLLDWAAVGPDEVGGDESGTVLVVSGVVGIGRLLTERWRGDAGTHELVGRLHAIASDSRWRVREGVAMAVQRWAESDPDAAFRTAEAWTNDTPFVQRAAVAAVCEPALIAEVAFARRAVGVVETVTADIAARPGRKGPVIDALRKALGYGWSVAVVADPELGRPAFERWAASPDPTIRWIVREKPGQGTSGADGPCLGGTFARHPRIVGLWLTPSDPGRTDRRWVPWLLPLWPVPTLMSGRALHATMRRSCAPGSSGSRSGDRGVVSATTRPSVPWRGSHPAGPEPAPSTS